MEDSAIYTEEEVQGIEKNLEEEKEKEFNKRRFKLALKNLILKLCIIAVACILFFFVIFGAWVVSYVDMQPSIQRGDVVLYYRFSPEYNVGDVVIFELDGVKHISRIMAIANSTVVIPNNGDIEINGFNQGSTKYYETYIDKEYEGKEFEVGNNQFFVLGDNRIESEDSRNFGVLNKDDIIGKVITVIRKSDI